MEALHLRNAEALDAMLEDGWLGASHVGHDGAAAAWRIVQHAISRPAFQRRCIELRRAAVEAREADPSQLAMLVDRVRSFEGRPQLYGTQFDWDDDGRLIPRGIRWILSCAFSPSAFFRSRRLAASPSPRTVLFGCHLLGKDSRDVCAEASKQIDLFGVRGGKVSHLSKGLRYYPRPTKVHA
jgi:hypothetical protein